jgi:hypothetical protein
MIIPHPQPHTPDPSPAEFSTNKALKIKNEKKIGALHKIQLTWSVFFFVFFNSHIAPKVAISPHKRI